MKTALLVGAAALAISTASLLQAATLQPTGSVALNTTKLISPNPGYQPVLDPRADDRQGLNMISTMPLNSTLIVDGESQEISGRTSMHLTATDDQLKRGLVEIKGFNVAYFNVPQRALSNGRDDGPETGVLGFAAKDMGYPQYLKYDPRSGRVSGEIVGYLDAAFMAAMVGPNGDTEKDEDLYETPTQKAYLSVDFYVDEPLNTLRDRARNSKEVQKSRGGIAMRLEAEEDFENDFPRYVIDIPQRVLEFEYTPIIWFEVAKRLCVQPVRIGRLKYIGGWPIRITAEYTGDGLAFGLPEARKQWAKADLVFNVKDWKTVWQSSYWEVTAQSGTTTTEESNLLAEVNDDQCVEVYFIDDFSPESSHGGGATWGSGTASAKIITSDGNARGGIDKTHLAHELGHVAGLHHPNAAATASLTPGSTGTLMCPSGWMNDNPQVNSQENKDNLSNPLFTFAFKMVSAGPDCGDSAACGACF